MNADELDAFVHALEPRIAELLDTDLEDAREFAGVVLYALDCNPKLYSATRESLEASILTCAKMRLTPGLGLGKFSLLKGENGESEAIFSPSWRGFIQLLHDHAGLAEAFSEVIHERDRFVNRPGADEFEFEQCTFGPRGRMQGVFVRLRFANGLDHVEVRWREDLESVTPDGPPDGARGKSLHDYEEFLKTSLLKTATKWVASVTRKGASILAAAIELERGMERCRVIPSAVRVARMLGIEITSRGEAEEPLPLSSGAQPLSPQSGPSPAPRFCCICTRSTTEVGPLRTFAVDPRFSSQTYCDHEGVHDLCTTCTENYEKVLGPDAFKPRGKSKRSSYNRKTSSPLTPGGAASSDPEPQSHSREIAPPGNPEDKAASKELSRESVEKASAATTEPSFSTSGASAASSPEAKA